MFNYLQEIYVNEEIYNAHKSEGSLLLRNKLSKEFNN